MAARKRSSTQSKLLNRAVKAGKSALRQARKRLPPDVRKQIDRTVKDGQKTINTAIKQVETRLDRTARQADLERAMKRLDALTKQVRNIASRVAAASAPTSTTRSARKPATRKAATRTAATRKAAPKRRPTRRRTTRTAAAAEQSAPGSTPETNAENTNGS